MLWSTIVLAASGCYARHEARPDPGATPRDAGRDAARADAGLDAGFDSGVDAGPPDAGPPPLPCAPAPDPGPDGRPSDDPHDWGEPLALDEDADCCVLGETVELPAPGADGRNSDPPVVVGWGPGEWGIGTMYRVNSPEDYVARLGFYRLAPDATRLSDVARITSAPVTPPTHVIPHGASWNGCRWAIPIAANRDDELSPREAWVHLLDRAGRPAALLPMGEGFAGIIDAAYIAHGDRWVGFVGDADGVRAYALDEHAGSGAGARLPLGVPSWLRAVGLRSRVAVAFGGGNPVGPGRVELATIDTNRAIIERLPLVPSRMDGAALARVRDLVAVALEDRARVHVQLVDPFEMSPTADRTTLATARVEAVGAAGSDALGVVGVCWIENTRPTRSEYHRVVRFRMVGQTGEPVGGAVSVSEEATKHTPIAPSCAVGADARGFLVLWQQRGRISVRRVEPRP